MEFPRRRRFLIDWMVMGSVEPRGCNKDIKSRCVDRVGEGFLCKKIYSGVWGEKFFG